MSLSFNLEQERRANLSAIEALEVDQYQENEFRTNYEDLYTEDRAAQNWDAYRKEFASQTTATSEVVFRAHFLLSKIHQLSKTDTILNWGCLYGWLEHSAFKEGYFITGIDRSQKIIEKNRSTFPGAGFEQCSSIFEWLSSNRASVLIQSNIGTYFLPPYLIRVYKEAAKVGVTKILIFEPSGQSRDTGEYFNYSTNKKPSLVFRGPMLLNNYPNFLNEAGFSISESEILEVPHSHPDYRSAWFVGDKLY